MHEKPREGYENCGFALCFSPSKVQNSLLKRIYNALVPGGSLILIEKIKSKIPDLNKTFMDFHHQFKEENGYSKLEISQKREALENVLIPWTIEQNNQIIQSSGFSKVELFSWGAFRNFFYWLYPDFTGGEPTYVTRFL